ncbi:hypothetical protein AB0A95_30925 [Micromonospora sp. NPDC049230]|uniref:hypothetical protein n=1 Tax=Micromonospora sp. NPDC049230 TaxID=3155502 RepID=UPI0033EF51B8
MIRCPRCRARLNGEGYCPGTLPLLDPRHDGREYGTAHQLIHQIGGDLTTGTINNWRRRDGLECHRVGRTVYSPLDQAAEIEADKRLGGRGRPRQLDATLDAAA